MFLYICSASIIFGTFLLMNFLVIENIYYTINCHMQFDFTCVSNRLMKCSVYN